jgi:hypothetical protein
MDDLCSEPRHAAVRQRLTFRAARFFSETFHRYSINDEPCFYAIAVNCRKVFANG